MAAKQSQEMKNALEYVKSMSVTEAAKLAGVNRTSLHDVLRKIRLAKENAEKQK